MQLHQKQVRQMKLRPIQYVNSMSYYVNKLKQLNPN